MEIAIVRRPCCWHLRMNSEDRRKSSGRLARALAWAWAATCGALCGASMVMGLCNKSGKPTAAIMRELLHEFQEKAGATICKDLKGIETGRMLCSCDDCVRYAVRAAEKHL